MSETIETLITIILWIIEPFAIFSIFLFALRIASRTSDKEVKLSAKGGIWAGVILFLIYSISQFKIQTLIEHTFDFDPNFNILYVLLGVMIGFFFLLATRFLIKTRLIGLITLTLTSVSLSSLYSYIFILGGRSFILFTTLGLILGGLLHVVIFPDTIRDLWD